MEESEFREEWARVDDERMPVDAILAGQDHLDRCQREPDMVDGEGGTCPVHI